jgi:hypothetical protein
MGIELSVVLLTSAEGSGGTGGSAIDFFLLRKNDDFF